MILGGIMLRDPARYKRSQIVCLHSLLKSEMSRIDQSLETDSRLVAAWAEGRRK